MQYIKFLQGLPGSGKSTFAKRVVELNKDYVIVSRSEISKIVEDVPYTEEIHDSVFELQKIICKIFLSSGKSVLLDDMNFAPKYWEYFSELSVSRGIHIERIFFDVPVEECIDRDSKREKPIGKVAIELAYTKYLKGKNHE
jgi:predicted kinase